MKRCALIALPLFLLRYAALSEAGLKANGGKG
ncbi:hypothetical protein APP86_17160 [Salmonella enterica subsp. houtenae]|nr:hypothetical protein APP86_17160 [Salmonella enterica subsp. houtenae]